jgi:hypothetical protein
MEREWRRDEEDLEALHLVAGEGLEPRWNGLADGLGIGDGGHSEEELSAKNFLFLFFSHHSLPPYIYFSLSSRVGGSVRNHLSILLTILVTL